MRVRRRNIQMNTKKCVMAKKTAQAAAKSRQRRPSCNERTQWHLCDRWRCTWKHEEYPSTHGFFSWLVIIESSPAVDIVQHFNQGGCRVANLISWLGKCTYGKPKFASALNFTQFCEDKKKTCAWQKSNAPEMFLDGFDMWSWYYAWGDDFDLKTMFLAFQLHDCVHYKSEDVGTFNILLPGGHGLHTDLREKASKRRVRMPETSWMTSQVQHMQGDTQHPRICSLNSKQIRWSCYDPRGLLNYHWGVAVSMKSRQFSVQFSKPDFDQKISWAIPRNCRNQFFLAVCPTLLAKWTREPPTFRDAARCRTNRFRREVMGILNGISDEPGTKMARLRVLQCYAIGKFQVCRAQTFSKQSVTVLILKHKAFGYLLHLNVFDLHRWSAARWNPSTDPHISMRETLRSQKHMAKNPQGVYRIRSFVQHCPLKADSH